MHAVVTNEVLVGNTYKFGVLDEEQESAERHPDVAVNSSSPQQPLPQSPRTNGAILGIRRTYFLFGVMTALVGIALVVSLCVALLVNWSSPSSRTLSPALPSTVKGNVTVYYAASLQNLMTSFINPDFTLSYGYQVTPVSAASGTLTTRLQQGAAADVFISAAISYDTTLLASKVPGRPSTSVLSWYATFARSRLGIAYNINSPFRATLDAVASGALPWYTALDTTQFNMKIGRTDPNIDPKGYRTVIMARLAENYYKVPGIAARVLGSPRNNLQLYTEQNLEELLQQGNIDAGFFYECEHAWTGNLRFVYLPQQIDFSNSSLNAYYAKANYTNTVTGTVSKGSAVIYTVAIPALAPNPVAAVDYVSNLLSLNGGAQLVGEGLYPTAHVTFVGNLSAVPTAIRSTYSK